MIISAIRFAGVLFLSLLFQFWAGSAGALAPWASLVSARRMTTHINTFEDQLHRCRLLSSCLGAFFFPSTCC